MTRLFLVHKTIVAITIQEKGSFRPYQYAIQLLVEAAEAISNYGFD